MNINLDVLEQLMPNVLTVATQLAATFVLFHFMKKLAWEPVREILHKRSEMEQSKLTEAQRLKEESEAMNEQANAQLQQAGNKAKKLIEVGTFEAERIKKEILDDAERQSEQTRKEARREIAYEREKMREDVHREIVDVALLAAEKLLSEKIDQTSDRATVENFVKEVVNR